MKRVEFRVTYPADAAHPLHRRVGREEAVSRMELLAWGPTDTVTTLSWYDAGRETVAEVLTAVETVTERHLVEGDGGTYAFLHQTGYEFDADLLELVAESRVVFRPPVTFLNGGDATVEAVGETRALSEFYERLRGRVRVTVERVRDFRRGASPSRLTDRQRAALEAGTAVGYYEVPRTGSVEAVAAELGCAPSTAGELLRKAESAVVADYTSDTFASERRRR